MTRIVILHLGGNRYDPLPNGHHTSTIWKELSRDACEYHVIARSKLPVFNHSRNEKVQLHLIPSLTARMLEFFITSWLVLFYIYRIRPTHLVVQCPVMGGLPAAVAANIWKIPLLVELHGTHYFRPTRPGAVGRIEHFLYKKLSPITFRAAERIRSLSRDMTNSLNSTYGPAVSDKAFTVPTRVNTEVFRPSRKTYAIDGPIKLISVGGLHPNKNHAALISALQSSNLDYKLTIVGEGPERANLMHILERAKLTERVKLAGHLDQLELAKQLNSNDVYIHYSKAEGLSRAILEAMACGCPVVTTNVGFIDGVLQNRINACVITPPWDHGLIQVLEELYASEAFRKGIGLAGSATVALNYEAEKVFQEYRQLIQGMQKRTNVA